MASELAVHAAALKLLIKPTESLKFASEVLEAPTGSEIVAAAHETNRVQTASAARRYLVLISSFPSGVEEAALVVFRRPSAPLITRLLPIYADFQLSISQKKANHSPTSALERSRFQITFSAPGTPSPAEFSLVTEVIDPFTELIAEIKRLHAIAIKYGWAVDDKRTHGWTSGYKPFDGTLDKETLAQFDSISSAYSMRMAATASALRTGLSSIDWGGPKPASPVVISKEEEARDQRGRWIVSQLQKREEEFTAKEDITVFCGTWNVNDKLPDGADLSAWVAPSEGAELLVFGFQELDLTTEALVRYTPHREDLWRTAIEKGLGDRAELYEKVHSRQLVGALSIVYALKTKLPNISCISSSSVATGILGLVANKGATAIRLRYKDSYLTFVNSHLAPFASQVEKRNQEHRDIGRYLSFPYEDGKKERDPWTPNSNPVVERPLGALGIYDSHQLIWVGDLNYRLDLPRTDVLRMIEAGEWELLARFDQLAIQKQHALAWTDFEEPKITFAPTYKFDLGTSEYDTSEKLRTPSWTDRIQWLSLHQGTIKCLNYSSHPELTLSDHQPVSAMLKVQVLSIIAKKRQQVQEEIMAELETFDNDQLPDVKILPGPTVQFETIDYLIPEVRRIEVKNVGRVIAQWAFVLKPEATNISEPWLHIQPTSGLILPGESTEVTLTLIVDAQTAPALNFSTDPDILSDLLILSIEKKDLFLAVQARHYNATVFCNTLEQLAKLGKPIRLATPDELDTVREDKGDFVPEKGSVPHEVFRMVDFLAEYALELDDVFLAPGSESLIRIIRVCLDTGDPFPLDVLLPGHSAASSVADSGIASEPYTDFEDDNLEVGADIGSLQLSPTCLRPRSSPAHASAAVLPAPDSDGSREDVGVYSMADCFLRFLESLSEPVISFAAYPRALRADQRSDAYRVVESLPIVAQNTLLYLIAFLKVLVARTKNVAERLARIDRLAVVFSSVLLRAHPLATPDSLPPASIPRRRKMFILHLLSDLNEASVEAAAQLGPATSVENHSATAV